MIKNSIAGLVAGLVATTGILGISALTTKEGHIEIVPTTEPITCEQCQNGEQGPRGYTGTGTKGDKGDRGVKGNKGDSVTVDEVLAALDARIVVEPWEYNLSDSAATTTTVALTEGTYGVSVFHASANYFGASLTGNGKNVVFASQSGYVSTNEDVKIITAGDYTINVTAEGPWTLDIIKK